MSNINNNGQLNKMKMLPQLSKSSQLSSKHAFCDLCRRQFYSKSFLRNHMKKIHCIQLPDSDIETSAAPKADYSPTMPSAKATESEAKFELDEEIGFESHYTNSVSTSSGQSKFKQSAKMISNKPPKSSTAPSSLHSTTNKLIKKKAFNLLNRNNLSVNASLLNCMSTVRVNCNICNKELCNKYFLRQHVEKSHKLSFNSYIEKYDVLSADAYENNYKHNQTVTHQLVRSILINHQHLLHPNTDNSKNSTSSFSSSRLTSNFKRRILMKNRKLIKSFQQRKCLSKSF